MKTINEEKDNFPYLTKIMIKNKINLEKSKPIENPEIDKYLNNIKILIDREINYDHNNINLLLNIIFDATYYNKEKKLILPTQIISETLDKKFINNNIIPLSYVLAGDTFVGKTAFLDRYLKYIYKEEFLGTIGLDKEIKYVKIFDNIYKITLWDQSGHERFRNFPKKYYQNADGFLLLFDLTYKETFDNISSWINNVKENSNKYKPLIYLIGNKIDDLPNREVSKEEAVDLAESLRIPYFEISCKYNINIYDVMTRMIIESIMGIGIDGTLKDDLRKYFSRSRKKNFNNSFKNILNKYKSY